MKFVFKNLGPINEAELELGDLTIIAGRNNTGKTYVAYTLYGFLEMWAQWPEFWEILDELSEQSFFPDFSDSSRLVEMFMKEGQVKWSIDQERLRAQQELIMQKVAQSFSEEELTNVFSSSHEEFEGASVEVVVEDNFPEKRMDEPFSFSPGNDFTISYSNNEMRIFRSKASRKALSSSDISFHITDHYLSFLFPKLLEPFILCAERFGISLFYKELDATKNRVVEMAQENRRRDRFLPLSLIDRMTSRYALPIRDNIDYTRDIPYIQKRQSQLYGSKLFDDIRNMLGGYYRSSSDDIRFISRARKVGRFDIPLHIASSSVRGLSDLYFFLRHAAYKDQLLIIDEPESHLDTANQILLARLLARSVHAGLKVLITTHSDYIIKEINNLLMLSAPFEEKNEVLKELGYSKHDFLKPASVRAYVAEKNTLTQCTIEKYGIDMPVFDKTIDAINRVSSELSVRLKYEGDE